jgi:hypothetical protein
MTMNRKVAAVLLAATMLATPAFAAGVVSSTNTSTAQTVIPEKVIKAPDVKKRHARTRASHGANVHHARHATSNKVKHANKISKKKMPPATTKSDTKSVAAVPVKTPLKN